MTTTEKKLTEFVVVRLTEQEAEALAQAVRLAGSSRSAFVRKALASAAEQQRLVAVQ